MPRFLRFCFAVALSVSHADVSQSCSEPIADESEDASSLLQKFPTVPTPTLTSSSKRHSIPAFASFIELHEREYREGSVEYEHRRSIYETRAREAQSFNERPNRLWTAGINHLSDWTDGELSRLRGWKGTVGRQSGTQGASGMSLLETTHALALPEEVSWTHLNATRVVRNQGGCGSCWAFATTLMLEANHEIHQKTDRTFSVQELVDCVPNRHNCGGMGGCNGATVELAVDYAIKHGLDDSIATPYVGRDTHCSKDLSLVEAVRPHSFAYRFRDLLHPKANSRHAMSDHTNLDDIQMIITPGLHTASDTWKGPSAFALLGWERLPENKYEPLMRALVEQGPVAVSVAATPWSSYMYGVFDGCDADAVIDHAVTLVGYGKDHEVQAKFWLIQNSWGPYWGEAGRIRLLRRDNEEAQCGTDRQPEDGTACDGGPTEVTVCGMCGILYDTVVPHFSKAQ